MDRVMKCIYKCHGKEDALYQELLREVSLFMERSRMKNNLIPAILRIQNKHEEKPLFFMK